MISIITPLYYGKKYINKLIKMIVTNVTHVSDSTQVEFIMINDSPKESISQDEVNQIKKSILDEMMEHDVNLNVYIYNNKMNRGIHFSRVYGMEKSLGEYVLFLDQDDELTSDALSIYENQIVKDKSNIDVWIANGYRKYSDHMDLIYRKDIMKMLGSESYYLYGTDLIFSPGQCLIRKKAISEIWKKQILSVNGCDDFFLWLLMLDQGCVFYGINDCLYYHMETGDNFSNSSDNMEKSYEEMCRMLDSIKVYPFSKIRILKRRGELKHIIKSESPFYKKIYSILRNPRVMWFTILYKIKGYH